MNTHNGDIYENHENRFLSWQLFHFSVLRPVVVAVDVEIRAIIQLQQLKDLTHLISRPNAHKHQNPKVTRKPNGGDVAAPF